MARTDAMSITTDGSETKDKLAESYGKVIESIQKGAISEKIKNTDYSGDPTTGSVEVNRFKNAQSNDYGTARTAGKGDKLANKGKVTINIDQDKEIIEEIEEKDVRLFGVADIIARRSGNHSLRMIATLDKAYFTALETEGSSVSLDESIVDIEEVAEAMIQSITTTQNDYVDGVERDMVVMTLTPAAYGKLRNYIDKVSMPTADSGEEEIAMFHGVRVYENVRQTKAIIATILGSGAQPVLVNEYKDEKIPMSNAHAVELFYSYGTKVVTPDLVKYLEELPSPKVPEDELGGVVSATSSSSTKYGKKVSTLQSDITIEGNKIKGTLKHVTGYENFSSDKSEQEGNFLALDLKANEGVTIKTKVDGGTKGEVTVGDGYCVYRIANKASQKIQVTFEKDGNSETKVYDLTGLDCQTE